MVQTNCRSIYGADDRTYAYCFAICRPAPPHSVGLDRSLLDSSLNYLVLRSRLFRFESSPLFYYGADDRPRPCTPAAPEPKSGVSANSTTSAHNYLILGIKMVENKGFEPLTPCVQGRCSPSWANSPHGNNDIEPVFLPTQLIYHIFFRKSIVFCFIEYPSSKENCYWYSHQDTQTAYDCLNNFNNNHFKVHQYH